MSAACAAAPPHPGRLPRTQRRSRRVQYLGPCHKGQGARRRLAALLPRPVCRDRGLVVIAAHRLHAQAPRVPHHLAAGAGASLHAGHAVAIAEQTMRRDWEPRRWQCADTALGRSWACSDLSCMTCASGGACMTVYWGSSLDRHASCLACRAAGRCGPPLPQPAGSTTESCRAHGGACQGRTGMAGAGSMHVPSCMLGCRVTAGRSPEGARGPCSPGRPPARRCRGRPHTGTCGPSQHSPCRAAWRPAAASILELEKRLFSLQIWLCCTPAARQAAL